MQYATNMYVTAHSDQSLVLGCSAIQDLMLQAPLCGHVNVRELRVKGLIYRHCAPPDFGHLP